MVDGIVGLVWVVVVCFLTSAAFYSITSPYHSQPESIAVVA
jgi:hypothetical protein